MKKKLKKEKHKNNTKIFFPTYPISLSFSMWILCVNKRLKNRWKWNNYLSCLYVWNLTAFIPLSCWPIVITITVMSCHLTPQSVNNCQGCLGFSPSKAKHSRCMSSISLRYSEEPWNLFKALAQLSSSPLSIRRYLGLSGNHGRNRSWANAGKQLLDSNRGQYVSPPNNSLGEVWKKKEKKPSD